jgi:hypothetical protein
VGNMGVFVGEGESARRKAGRLLLDDSLSRYQNKDTKRCLPHVHVPSVLKPFLLGGAITTLQTNDEMAWELSRQYGGSANQYTSW